MKIKLSWLSQILGGVLIAGFSLLLLAYLYFNPGYRDWLVEWTFVPGFVTSLLGFGFGYAWWRQFKLNMLTALGYIITLWLWLALVVLLFFLPVGFLGDTSVFVFLFRSFFHISWTLLLLTLFGFWVVMLGMGIGTLFSVKARDYTSFIVAFCVGAGVLSVIVFVLSKLGLFYPALWVGLFMGTQVLLWPFWQRSWHFFTQWNVSLDRWQVVGLAGLGSVVGLNILQGSLPFSLGWDASNQYLLTVKTLLEEGHLRSGVFPPFGELLSSIPGLVTGIAGVNLWLILLGGLLPLGIYIFLVSLPFLP